MSTEKKSNLTACSNTKNWSQWEWQLQHSINSIETLRPYYDFLNGEEHAVNQCLDKFKMSIPPYYFSLINKEFDGNIIKRQSIPSIEELHAHDEDQYDPLHEDIHSPTPGLIHRYPDRVLLLVTDLCAMYCRYCTRRRLVGKADKTLDEIQLAAIVNYIENHKEVRDVLLSGGDPLMLSDSRLESIISRIKNIKHVEIIRIGTRIPVVLPQRITDSLVNMLKKYHPLWINTHFNHPCEITPESSSACIKLADAGIPLGNQTVLLAGVNDCVGVMKKLVTGLVKIRVRPYYLYQCDLSEGLYHFRTSVEKGIEIIEGLRGHITGLCVPTFVVDAPDGRGKIPIMPEYTIKTGKNSVTLRNFKGEIAVYQEPDAYVSQCDCEDCRNAKKMSSMFEKEAIL